METMNIAQGVAVKVKGGWQIRLEDGKLLPKVYSSKELANKRIGQMKSHKADADDTYHNRFAPDRKHNKGDKKFKILVKKCAKCGTTSGQLDINHKDGNRKNNNRSNLQYMCRSCHRKMHAKKNGGKGELIISTAARIIDDPQSKASEALASSHRNFDIMHVEFILCHANVNANRDRFTSDDLQANADTAVLKPINWEHRNINIGTIYESKFISIASLEEDAKSYYKKVDPLEDDFVVVRAAIWEYKHPREAEIMREREAKGELYFSMENHFEKAKCSKCGEEYESPYEYCDHLLNRRSTGDSDRIFVGSNFIGSATTRKPADDYAGTLALAAIELVKYNFSSLLLAKAMKTIDIETEIIPYIVTAGNKDMVIKQRDIPKDFLSDLDLDNESFADSVNKVFPIDTVDNIEASAKLALNDDLPFYSNQEKLKVVEEICKAAKEYDIEITEFIDEQAKDNNIGGNELMGIEKNSPEFKQALAEALNEKLKEIESGEELKNLQDQISKAGVEKVELETKVTEVEKTIAAKDKEFTEFKDQIEAEKTALARWESLTKEGLEFENEDKVKEAIAKMDEDSFTFYRESLISTAAKFVKKADEEKEKEKEKEMTPEEKKKAEEKRKAEEKKKKEAKASDKLEDPVKESEKVALANKVENDKVKDKFATIDRVLRDSLNLA